MRPRTIMTTIRIVAFLTMGMVVSWVPNHAEASMQHENLKTATLAGGCFWCVESDMEKIPGVEKVISGYTGGDLEDPSYEQVSSGATEHREAVEIHYDPTTVSFAQLLEVFWRHHDPTDAGGSFGDRGQQYTSAIFYHDEEQKKTAEESIEALNESGRFDKPVITQLIPYTTFYPAEEYHQDYYKKNPVRYKTYRFFSGRDRFSEKHWGDEADIIPEKTKHESENKYDRPSDAELKERLTPLQYKVVREEGTEPAFNNKYWDNHEEGIYVDIVSGEPLFSSREKFESGTGWPSFTRPLEPDNIVERADDSLFMRRTEVRSRHGDSHLGHVFTDGPEPTGLRYCMNSAALRFIPKDRLEEEGYGEYRELFQ